MTTLKDAIRQAIEDHGSDAIWSDGGTDWTLDNYLDETITAHAQDSDHYDYVLCESADGWSLHAPGSTDEDIASGDAPYLASGAWDNDDHIVPSAAYDAAHDRLGCNLYELEPVQYDGKTIRRYRADGYLDTGEAMLTLRPSS